MSREPAIKRLGSLLLWKWRSGYSIPVFFVFCFLFQSVNGQNNEEDFHSSNSSNTENVELKLEEFEQLKQNKEFKKAGQLAYQIAMDYLMSRDFDQAFKYYDLAIETAKSGGDYEILTQAMEARSEMHYVLSHRRKAVNSYKELYKIYDQIRDTLSMSNTLASVGNCFRELNELDSALNYIELAFQISPETDDLEHHGQLYRLAAGTYADLGQLDIALDYYMKALAIFEELGNVYAVQALLHEICIVLIRNNDLDRGLDFAYQALALSKTGGSRLKNAHIYKTIGEIKSRQQLIDSAFIYFNNAITIFQEKNKSIEVADLQIRIGKLYIDQGQYERALAILDKSSPVFEDKAFEKELARVKMYKGLAYAEMKNYDVGIQYLEQSKLMSERANDIAQLKFIYKKIADVYAERKNFELAYNNHLKYKMVEDSINSMERSRVIKELETKYRVEQKDQNILRLSQTASDSQAKLRSQNYYIIGLVIGAALFLLVSIILYRNLSYNKLIAKQKEEINQHKIKELKKDKRLVTMQAMIEGQEQERRRVAQDLHDGLGGLLSTVKLKFDAAKMEQFSFGQSKAYEKGSELLDLACHEVRKIAHNMMPGAITKFGLIPAIKDMCLTLEKAQGIRIDFQTINWTRQLSEDLSITIYRIIQELLNNISKHSNATEAIVQLSCHEEYIHLVVEDNGQGFEANSSSDNGLGLSSIKSRVDYLNGKLEIESFPNQGTTFNINFPLEATLLKY